MKLVQQFGSLEGVIQNADKLKGKQQENVVAFAEQGLKSKQLATIIIDVIATGAPQLCTNMYRVGIVVQLAATPSAFRSNSNALVSVLEEGRVGLAASS